MSFADTSLDQKLKLHQMDNILKIICWFYVLSAIEAATLGASCNNTVLCTPTVETCTSNVCECGFDYFNVSGECKSKTRLAPTITNITSTTSKILVYWSHPSSYYDLLSNYEVTWKANGSSGGSSGLLEKTVKQYTVSSHLMAGQLYIVNVITHAYRTNPATNIVVNSSDATIRLVPQYPGYLLTRECDFAHDNLLLKWEPPVETFVTKYEVRIDGITYTTTDFFPMLQINGKVFLPGWRYKVRLITVSGTTNVKKSLDKNQWIRTTPTRPGPPTNVKCLVDQLDISLEISWTAPTNPNGVIVQYQININPGKMDQANITSVATKKIVDNLIPEHVYSFTVRTINDAAESIRISDPSQAVSCKTKAMVETTLKPQTSTVMQSTVELENTDTVLAPNITKLTSTTSKISVYWSHPNTQYDLVSNYEVTWKVNGSSVETSGLLERTVKEYTVSRYLIAGQLYIVNVICHTDRSNPSSHTAVSSDDASIRLIPQYPGYLLSRECDFSHDNLLLKWEPPVDTFVTRYELRIDGKTYTTRNFFPMLQFTGEVFLPAWRYNVRIITVSGTDNVKKSIARTRWILTISTKPGPPTDVKCVVNPLDTSLDISWIPPINPNGVIVQYQININPGEMDQVNISSTSTKKTIKNLLPENTYTFAVRTINNAAESISVSSPSHEVSCKLKAEIETSSKPQTTSAMITTQSETNETGLIPIITDLTSTTSSITVHWSHPSNHSELVNNYEVIWRTEETSTESTGLLDKSVKQFSISRYLMAGQLYIVNVIAHVDITYVLARSAVHSMDATVRLVPRYPGYLISRECDFSHDNLLLKWEPPVDTFVTRYEVRIDGKTYATRNFFPMLQFTGDVFLPGWRYNVRIITVSGTDNVKKSFGITRWILTISTKPGPPTDINCAVNQIEDSIEISWKAPTNPNGVIIQYQININPGNHDQKNISSGTTKKIIKYLLPEQTYSFTVRTINNAAESIRVSDPSQTVSCQIKPKANDSTALPTMTMTTSKVNTMSKATSWPPVTSTPQIKETVSIATSMPPITATPQIEDTENCKCKSSGATIPTSPINALLFALIWIPAWIIQKIDTGAT
ncbi:phosphatidylinositol phosphatase PTPRQ-like isoform X3 [Crassostrea angulata]|uniref:phosphatidylinositol phosphatase PTPRQ-like isoform X3 n=1 Tax=Magallana angulata TaxID=2784310 RepID=UPI0022B16E4F|nr:phosphatidylinositol phosphatase PTPRQ-like isoform X3 [Crassostrea angulata]